MSITFDNLYPMTYMYFFDASAGTYAARNMTSGDYFANDAAVGDCLYVGMGQGGGTAVRTIPFHDVVFNIGTALVADAITVVWEYKLNGIWTAIPDVVDGTNAFRNAGSQTVTFPVPQNWGISTTTFCSSGDTIPAITSLLIRCRITAVTNITEGGANSTTAIQAKDNGITLNGEVSSNFTAIYNADVAGGWGKVTKNRDQFFIGCNLFLVSTSFVDSEKQVQIGEPGYEVGISVDSNSSIQFGTLDSAGYGIAGCALRYYSKIMSEGPCAFYNPRFYGCLVQKKGGSQTNGNLKGTIDVRDSIIGQDMLMVSLSGVVAGSSIARTLLDYNYYFYVYSPNCSFNQISLANGCLGVLCGQDATFTNSDLTGKRVTRYYGAQVTLINCSGLANRATLWLNNSASGTVDVHTYEKYTLDLTAVDEKNNPVQNATVRVFDNTGTLVATVTTDSNGVITQQTLTAYVATWAYAAAWARTDTDYNPFEIVVSKPGYETLRKKVTLSTTTNKQHIKLRHSPSTGRDDMGSAFR